MDYRLSAEMVLENLVCRWLNAITFNDLIGKQRKLFRREGQKGLASA
jgi:hypothetical protein